MIDSQPRLKGAYPTPNAQGAYCAEEVQAWLARVPQEKWGQQEQTWAQLLQADLAVIDRET